MKKKERMTITSEEDLRVNASVILRHVNSDERGGLLFLINPVFALEEAGFDLTPAMRRHIRHGLRYGTKTKTRIAQLEREVAEIAGHAVNAASDKEISSLLFERLKLPLPAVGKQSDEPQQAKGEPTIYEPETEIDEEKPEGRGLPRITMEMLQSLRERHPVVPKILELRTLRQSGWRFVNRETYEKVKNGASVTLLRRVRFRRQRREPS